MVAAAPVAPETADAIAWAAVDRLVVQRDPQLEAAVAVVVTDPNRGVPWENLSQVALVRATRNAGRPPSLARSLVVVRRGPMFASTCIGEGRLACEIEVARGFV